MNNIKTKLVFYILIGLFFLLNIWVWNISLLDVLDWIEKIYSVPMQKQEVLFQYINKASLLKLKIVFIICSLFSIICYWYGLNSIKQVCSSIKYSIVLLQSDLLSLNKKEKYVLCSFVLLFGSYLLWFSHQIYFQLDELNSLLYFVDRGFLVTISYYPSNNNHIGYNVISVFWNLFLEPSLAIRMTSILSSLGVMVIFYLLLLRRYNFLLAFVGVTILISFSSFTWYATQGRGYMLELFLLILLFYFILQAKSEKTDYIIILLSSYTLWVLPISIIPLFVLGIFAIYIIRKDEFLFRRLIKVFLAIVLITILLYLPVFVFSDVSVLYSNPFVKHVLYKDVPWVLVTDYLPGVGSFLIGIDGWYLLLMLFFMIGITVWMTIRRSYEVLFFVLTVLIFPALLFLIYPVLLFERTWIWLLFPLVFWIIDVFYFLQLRTNKLIIISAISFLVGSIFIVNVNLLNSIREDTNAGASQLEELRRCICKEEKVLRVDSDVLYTYFRFYQQECRFLLKDGVQEAKKGDWILVSNKEAEHTKFEIACKNSIGTLYKLK